MSIPYIQAFVNSICAIPYSSPFEGPLLKRMWYLKQEITMCSSENEQKGEEEHNDGYGKILTEEINSLIYLRLTTIFYYVSQLNIEGSQSGHT